MLYSLLTKGMSADVTHRIISLTGDGVVGEKFRAQGFQVETINMLGGNSLIFEFAKLIQILKKDPPDLIQSWMYHSDFVGTLASVFLGGIPIVWGVHHTLDTKDSVKRRTRVIIQINAIFSHWFPKKIICCARSVKSTHERLGYSSNRMMVIPNGVDTEKFNINEEAKDALISELHLDTKTQLIGFFARYHPQKDHRNFAQAAHLLLQSHPGVHFLLAGNEITYQNNQLIQILREAKIESSTHLLGIRSDMPVLMAGVDIVCLPSAFGEALPVSIIEAMSCATPCVVTDVGDAAILVEGCGRIVPPHDPVSLSNALLDLLSLQTIQFSELRIRSRERVLNTYRIENVLEQYETLYREILNGY